MSQDIVGLLAALVSTGSLAPQVYRTWRSRSAGDISYGWLLAALLGTALWSVHGLLRSDWAVIGANLASGAMVAGLLAMKRRYASIR